MTKVAVLCLWVIVFLLGCSNSNSHNVQRSSPSALKNTSDTPLAKAYQQQIKAQRGKSGFVLMGSGMDAFAARTALFRKAQKSIDVQYYIVRDDLTGHLFYQSLIAAADRGVRVRILLDDLSFAKQIPVLSALDQHPRIEVRLFNPFSRHAPRVLQYVFRLGSITRRMHNKSVIVDNAMTIIGSRNIGNEYAETGSGRVESGLEVLAVGPVVRAVAQSFDQYWNFQKAVEVSHLTPVERYDFKQARGEFSTDPMAKSFSAVLKSSPLVKQIEQGKLHFRWGQATLIADMPDKIIRKRKPHGEFLNSTGLQPYIKNTREHLLIISAYFVPGEEGLNFFRQLRQRGVRVSVLTNSYASTDVVIVNAHYQKYRKALLQMGVNLYEFKSRRGSVSLLQKARNLMKAPHATAGLHAKILAFDRESLYVGAMNVDPRSLYENTEIGVVISSQEMTSEVLDWFDHNLDEVAYHVALHEGNVIWHDFAQRGRVLTKEPDTGVSQRLMMELMALLPVEALL